MLSRNIPAIFEVKVGLQLWAPCSFDSMCTRSIVNCYFISINLLKKLRKGHLGGWDGGFQNVFFSFHYSSLHVNQYDHTSRFMSHRAIYRQPVPGNLNDDNLFTFEYSTTFSGIKDFFRKITHVLQKWSCSMHCSWLAPSCM